MRGITTILLLLAANVFMTLAWYGHLRWFPAQNTFTLRAMAPIVLFSWGLAFFEYCLQVPANRWGFAGQGGPFSVVQLRVLQEVISLSVFFVLALYLDEKAGFRWNHAAAGLCLVAAVYFIFRGQ